MPFLEHLTDEGLRALSELSVQHASFPIVNPHPQEDVDASILNSRNNCRTRHTPHVSIAQFKIENQCFQYEVDVTTAVFF